MSKEQMQNSGRDLCIDWIFVKIPWILFWILVAILLWEVFSPRHLIGEVAMVDERNQCYVLAFGTSSTSDHLLVDKRLYPLAEKPDRLDTFLGWKLKAEGNVRRAESGGRFIHVTSRNQLEHIE